MPGHCVLHLSYHSLPDADCKPLGLILDATDALNKIVKSEKVIPIPSNKKNGP